MQEKDFFSFIERMNDDYKALMNSSEYRLGKDIVNIKRAIKGFQIQKLLLKLRQRSLPSSQPISENNEKEFDNSYKLSGRCAIYTCITGNYDEVLEPMYRDSNCDYFLFSDKRGNGTLNGWEVKKIPDDICQMGSIIANRYVKLQPHKLFPEYDYSIYVDGNILIVSTLVPFLKEINSEIGLAFHSHSVRDCIYEEARACCLRKRGNTENIKKQVSQYKEEKFPEHYGMCECNVIVTDLHNQNALRIMNEWWANFLGSESLRDQIPLPYVLWKNNIKVSEITTLGKNVRQNSKIRIISHN